MKHVPPGSGLDDEKPSNLPPPPAGRSGWPWTEYASNYDHSLASHHYQLPTISVITPSFNQGEFIEETIRSILLQRYPNLEYIVIDGGSTDNTVDILKRYDQYISYWVTEQDRGVSHGANKGFKKASGELIGWLNSDDYYAPGALHRIGNEYVNKKFMMLAGETNIVDSEGDLIFKKNAGSFSPELVLTRMKPGQSATFFHRDILETVGYLNEDLSNATDRDFILRTAARYYPDLMRNIPVVLSSFRLREGTLTGSGSRDAVAERIRVDMDFIKHHFPPHERARLKRGSLQRIYRTQALMDKRYHRGWEEIRYRVLGARQMRNPVHIMRSMARCVQIVLQAIVRRRN